MSRIFCPAGLDTDASPTAFSRTVAISDPNQSTAFSSTLAIVANDTAGNTTNASLIVDAAAATFSP